MEMADFISPLIKRIENGLIFLIDKDHSAGYDYNNYTPSLTSLNVPKKQLTFFFTNMTKRMNFVILREANNFLKVGMKIKAAAIFIEIFLYLTLIFFMILKDWPRWVCLIYPASCVGVNITLFTFIRNMKVVTRHMNNIAIKTKVDEYLKIENIYWFYKYQVIFEMDEDLNISMIQADEKYRLSARDIRLVTALAEDISDEKIKMLKDNATIKVNDLQKSLLANQEKYQNHWEADEFKVFFKYNKWDLRE